MKMQQLKLTALCIYILALRAAATTYYVDINSTSPTPPYTSWSTAATNIQDAVNQTTNGDSVLVNPGTYGSAGYLAPDGKLSCVFVTNAITLLSVDGSTVTAINASNTMRCIYLGSNSAMSGFTLTGGIVTGAGGGGVCCVSTDIIVSSCLLVSNTADGGGGAASGSFSNCVFFANSDRSSGGGGANNSILNNCLLIGNSAELEGGGAYSCIMNNCTLSNNWAPTYIGEQGNGGGAMDCLMSNCFVTGNYESGGGYGGGMYGGTAFSCVFSNNWADYGGGAAAYQLGSPPTVLVNCTFIDNAATNANGKDPFSKGGGAYGCILTNCLIEDNVISNGSGGINEYGGGADDCELNNCDLVSNAVYAAIYNGQGEGNAYGGGADASSLNNCRIHGNIATNFEFGTSFGGGVSDSTLQNCVVSNNFALSGGGAYGGTLNRCYILGNIAPYEGGGAANAGLYDCLITENIAGNAGGAFGGILVNCTVVNNSETNGKEEFTPVGGVGNATLENCIVYYNNAVGNNYTNFVPTGTPSYPDTMYNCCTFPAVPAGKNITNAPAFIDPVNGNFRLQTNSSCINAGNNSYVTNRVDLDGRPRIVGGKVDIGAYEFQGPGIGEFIAWLQQYSLPTDGTADNADLDGSGFTVYQDWIAGLNPTNPASVLAMLTPVTTNTATGVTVTWQSVSGIPYFLQRSTNLTSQPPFSTIQNSIIGQTNMTSYTDSSATNNLPYFYRVGVTAP